VNYGFEGDAEMNRPGNQWDLLNLRKTFETFRSCNYVELSSLPKKDLLDNLEDEQKLREQINLETG